MLPPCTTPLHSQVPCQLQQGSFARVVHGTNKSLVRNTAAHARDNHHRAIPHARVPLEHGAGGRRAGHEDAGIVDVHHLAHLVEGVVDSGLEVLDAGGGDHAVQPLVRVGDGANDVIEGPGIAHVDARVVQRAAELLRDARAGFVEVRGGLLEAVEAVDCVVARRRVSAVVAFPCAEI